MIELIAALPLSRPSRFQHPRLGPYLLLCEALLVDVFRTRDAYRRYLAQGRSLRRLKQQYEQDWQWVTSEEDASYALSFPHVCELLELDPTAVRKAFVNGRRTKFPRKSWGIRKVITVLEESKGSSSRQAGLAAQA